jgi:hypothetical protein
VRGHGERVSVVLGLRDRSQLGGDDEHLLGLRACLPVYREAAIESSDTPSLQTVDAKDDDTFEFDDERLNAIGTKTAEEFNAAVRQRLDRDRLTRQRPEILTVSARPNGTALSVSGKVQYGEAEWAFMVGERVVHDGDRRRGSQGAGGRCRAVLR